ncbi:MAG: hypothetical protein H7Z40_04755 [Phycisphaerae bacterium]|nr:hypothetical protein [Gemmatimonadaceae bacterium]
MEAALRIVALAAIVVALLRVSGVFNAGDAVAGAPVLFRTNPPAVPTQSFASMVRHSLLNPSAGPESGAHTLRPLHVLANPIPGDTSRALASAARFVGMPVRWTDSTAGRGAIALEVQPRIDPKGGYTLRVAAPAGVDIALEDSLGLIDSVRTKFGGANVDVGRVTGSVRAVAGPVHASAAVPSAPTLRRVLLFAEPGWEAKFTMAALEERGWIVEARYAIGKNVSVTQGAPANPDTARYAAVIALDSSARTHVAAIRRYAAAGGGVIVAGSAATLREFGDLLPGRAGTRSAGIPGALETAAPLLGLAWRPITPDSNAVVIERSARKGNPNATIVARRYGSGRVSKVAYDGVWEWRMVGPEGSVDAHRQWWSALVSSVAFAPEQSRDSAGALLQERGDEPGTVAPYADTRARLGAPVEMPQLSKRPERGTAWELLLTGLAVLLLLSEWASRRLRGAR